MNGLTASAFLLVIALAGSTSADKKVPPPTMSDLATVWVGGEVNGYLEYYRLELNQLGQGLLTVQSLPKQPADAYRVTATQLDAYSVKFTLQPIDAGAEPMYLRGSAISIRLNLEAGSTTLDWKRQLRLDRYEDVVARLDAVNRRAEQYWARSKE